VQEGEEAEVTQYVVRHAGLPKQMQFWQSGARFRAYIGGIGAGKTRAGLIEVIRQPASWGVVVSPVYQMLKDTIIPTVEETCSEIISQINRSDMFVKFKNGTTMLMRSADEPDRLRGPNLGWFWLDEPAQMDELVWKIVLGRIRVDPGRGWVTGTPAGKNWLYKKFVVESAGDPDFEMIHATSHENTFLPDYYLKELDKQYQGAFHQQEVRGLFVEWIDQPAYPSFSRHRNVVEHLMDSEFRMDLPIVVCCDFNHRLMCWPVGQVINGAPRVLTEIILEGEAQQVREMCNQLKKAFPHHGAGITFYGDASGGSESATSPSSAWTQIDEEFQNYPAEIRFMVPKKNPPEKSRLSAVNDALSGKNGFWSLQIDSACEVLTNDLERVEMNQTGSGVLKVHDKDDERALMTHASDALGYWIHMEWPTLDIRDRMLEAIKEANEQRKMTVSARTMRRHDLNRNTLLRGL
jgi:hypothetical protein